MYIWTLVPISSTGTTGTGGTGNYSLELFTALTKTPLRLSTSLKTFVRMLDSAKISQDVQEIRTTQPNRTRFSNRRSIPRFYLSMLSEK